MRPLLPVDGETLVPRPVESGIRLIRHTAPSRFHQLLRRFVDLARYRDTAEFLETERLVCFRRSLFSHEFQVLPNTRYYTENRARRDTSRVRNIIFRRDHFPQRDLLIKWHLVAAVESAISPRSSSFCQKQTARTGINAIERSSQKRIRNLTNAFTLPSSR